DPVRRCGAHWLFIQLTSSIDRTLASTAMRLTPHAAFALVLNMASFWATTARLVEIADVAVGGPGSSFDGVIAAVGDRILLIGQAAQSENGVWIFAGVGSPLSRPSASGDWVAGST